MFVLFSFLFFFDIYDMYRYTQSIFDLLRTFLVIYEGRNIIYFVLFTAYIFIFVSSLNVSAGDAAGLDAAIARAEQATANVRAVFAWEPPEMRRCRNLRFALQVRTELFSC